MAYVARLLELVKGRKAWLDAAPLKSTDMMVKQVKGGFDDDNTTTSPEGDLLLANRFGNKVG